MDSTQIDKVERPASATPSMSMPAVCCQPSSRVELLRGALRSWIGNRYALGILGLAIVGSGLAFGWSWLTAIGAAPVIVSVAPCLAMCAFGVCMMCRRSPQ